MLPPLIRRPTNARRRSGERGVTIALVAVAIFSIIAMAGLSIDIGTLYQASAEAQRAADVSALAAARVLSLSGMTGDPQNSSGEWNKACDAATTTANTVAAQNTVGGRAPSGVTVSFSATDSTGCSSTGPAAFGVNPMVTVQVTQASLPVYFARIWGRTGSSATATATAEVFNPSNSNSFSASGTVVPVQPRCVKPIIVPNLDPDNSSGCTGNGCKPFIGPYAGTTLPSTIYSGGIRLNGTGTGVIGESFSLVSACERRTGTCTIRNPPPTVKNANDLQYVPGQVLGTPTAVPSCATANSFQEAIAGCDQSTPYQCGVLSSTTTNPSEVDLNENPAGPSEDTATALDCLTDPGGGGPDALSTAVYPYQITGGGANPLGTGTISTSNSIVTIPIFDNNQAWTASGNTVAVTIVGFLQVFVNSVNDSNGNVTVTVLNVAGCGNGVSSSAAALDGTSPVPIRLITPP
jgi:Flp pilus assembly protein TadG